MSVPVYAGICPMSAACLARLPHCVACACTLCTHLPTSPPPPPRPCCCAFQQVSPPDLTPYPPCPRCYAPPQVSAAADVWALGGICLFALNKEEPYADVEDDLLGHRLAGFAPGLALNTRAAALCGSMAPRLAALVGRCMRCSPAERASVHTVVSELRAITFALEEAGQEAQEGS